MSEPDSLKYWYKLTTEPSEGNSKGKNIEKTLLIRTMSNNSVLDINKQVILEWIFYVIEPITKSKPWFKILNRLNFNA